MVESRKSNVGVDEERSLEDLEEEQARIAEEVKRRRRAALKAQKEAEERQLIAAGEGTRNAKKKALQESHWFEATGTKRPHSPGGNEAAQGNDGFANAPGKTGKEKRQKTAQRSGDDDGGGKEQSKKGRGKGAKVNTEYTGSKKSTAKMGPAAKTKNPTTASESESEAPSEPEDELEEPAANSSGEEEVEDDDDVSRMTDKAFRKAMDEEAPRDPSRLFDDDDDVEMVSIRSGRSRCSSSGASRPPTSESDGPGLGEQDDSDDEIELPPSPKKGRSKAAKPVKKRDAVFLAERPSTIGSRPANKSSTSKTSKSASRKQRSSTVVIDSDQEDDAAMQDTWPPHARLNPDGKLLKQNPFIRTICRDAIKIVEKTLITEYAWPELHRSAAYRRQVLLEAVQQLLAKDEKYNDLLKRIKKDDDFVMLIGKWVIDRLATHRGDIRGVASDFIALFQLGVGDGCMARVLALIDKDVYVYPGEWGTTEKGEEIWLTKRSQTEVFIYLSPALIDTIRYAFFATPTAFGYKFKDYYVSSHPTQPEPELTIPLVALGATALYAAIWEWRDGKKVVKVSKSKGGESSSAKSASRFDGEAFKAIYDGHIKNLTELKQKAPNTFHSVMSRLYAQVTAENAPANLGKKTEGNALSILDLAGLT